MLDIIFKRKSIRQFSPRIVTDEIIEEIIRAGMQAPSAGNSQPWEFVVVRNRNTLQKITEFHSYSQCLKMVNAAVVVCANLSREIYKGFWVQDCSACMQNMLLAVESIKGEDGLELGSVWLGVYPVAERVNGLKELLSLPEDVVPFAVLPVGYKGEKKNGVDNFKPERIHLETW